MTNIIRAIMIISILVLISGCDGGGSGSPAVSQFNADCIDIAGTREYITTTGDRITVNVSPNCNFTASSPASGKTNGILSPSDGGYYGIGNSKNCPSGKFEISLKNDILLAQCL